MIQNKETFELLKGKLISTQFYIYSPTDETELHCDASLKDFGAVLQRKLNKKFHPIFFKKTTEIDSRYHNYEFEIQ